MLKAIVAYLNSRFASYFLFLTTATWGVERERINQQEVLRLPAIPFLLERPTVNTLATKVDAIGTILTQGAYECEVEAIEAEIDTLIFDALNLSPNERLLIQDGLDYVIDYFQEGENSSACDPVYDGQLKKFAKTVCETINNLLQFGSTTVWATVYQGDSPLNIVTLHFNSTQSASTVKIIDVNVDSQLERINEKLREEYSQNIYLRRHIKLYEADSIDIIKPNEQRFWSHSTALNDADTILAEGVMRGEE